MTTKRTTAMSILSWVVSLYSSAPPLNTVEGVYWWAQIATLLLIGTTLVTGGITVGTGIVSARRSAIKIAGLETEVSNAKARADQEAVKRLELERAVNQRDLPHRPFDAAHSPVFDALHPFAGTKVVLMFLPQTEPSRAAGSIFLALDDAGWEIPEYFGNEGLDSEIYDGVVVFYSSPESKSAADALVGVLESNGWHVKAESDVRNVFGFREKQSGDSTRLGSPKLPDGWLRIAVGFKTTAKERW
jgi:hypothetical protein